MKGTICALHDVSPTAREVDISIPEELGFTAGAFINIFVEKDGEKLRRAYSLSSSDAEQQKVSIAIRKMPNGAVGPLFWNDAMLGTEIDIMGPLGLNTMDKMKSSRVFLFGFGIGAGVVKSLALSLLSRKELTELYILTGSKTEDEIVFEKEFSALVESDPRVTFIPVVSNPLPSSARHSGYIQNHIQNFDFTNADVYICGQEVACSALRTAIEAKHPQNTKFFIEAFH